jgi:broad specificity phosphatase PhoE
MSYTEIKFVRHPEAEHLLTPGTLAGHAPHSKLTETGHVQAERLGTVWRNEGYVMDKAHTSPLFRCREGLRLALEHAGLNPPVTVFPGLAEQCLGRHEGMPREIYTDPGVAAAIKVQGAAYMHPGHNAEGVPGQSMLDAAREGIAYILARRRETPPESLTLAVMGHAVKIKSMLSHIELAGLHGEPDPHELLDRTLSRPSIEPCAQTMVIVEGGMDPSRIRCKIEYEGVTLEEAEA